MRNRRIQHFRECLPKIRAAQQIAQDDEERQDSSGRKKFLHRQIDELQRNAMPSPNYYGPLLEEPRPDGRNLVALANAVRDSLHDDGLYYWRDLLNAWERDVFVTNNTTWVAKTIADIYKSRWQIELFFKWIKQHLKVKRFVGRSKNAVMTQLWVAMCMYLLLAYLKFVMRVSWSLHRMLQVLQLNVFERRLLQELFTTPSPPGPSSPPGPQLPLM